MDVNIARRLTLSHPVVMAVELVGYWVTARVVMIELI